LENADVAIGGLREQRLCAAKHQRRQHRRQHRASPSESG